MTLQRLKWLTIVAPLAFLAAVAAIGRALAPAFLSSWPGYLLLGGVVLLASLAFSETVFGAIERIQVVTVTRDAGARTAQIGAEGARAKPFRQTDLLAVVEG